MKATECILVIAAVAVANPAAAHAETIRFGVNLELSCTMVVEHGELAPNSDYTQISSENAGGKPATLQVTALGGLPKISFAGPSTIGWNLQAGTLAELRYTSTEGVAQGFTSRPTSVRLSSQSDDFEIHARAIYAPGFRHGPYAISTTATCGL